VWFDSPESRTAVESSSIDLQSHPWCPGAWTTTASTSELLRRVADGGVVIQDPSSQIVARIADHAAAGRRHAVDLCAAPGGKTALLRRLGDWNLLVAAELNPAKAGRLRGRLKQTPVIVGDASRPPLERDTWDLVLLDAPCSGSGTFRRHPELKWRLTSRSITESAHLQRPMIEACFGLLAPGGVLVYATCSVEPEENEAHFNELPAGHELVPPDPLLPAGLPWIDTKAGGARILPHEHGDGFTVHLLRRR
jgi:16S rRNA (cytosine967-C5)-methyltransferase